MKKSIPVLFLLVFVIPSVAFASWWNPLSWFNHKAIEKSDVIIPVSKSIDPIIKETPPQAQAEIKSNLKDKATTIKNIPIKEKVPVVNNPRASLIAQFLKNSTLENLKSFCSSAKNVQGNSTKQVLDGNKEKMITVNKTLYEEMVDCQRLDNIVKDMFLFPLDDSSLVLLSDNDNDLMREAKIIYNDRIKNLTNTSRVKIFGFYRRESSPKDFFKCAELSQSFKIKTEFFKNATENNLICFPSPYTSRLKYINNYIHDLGDDFK